MNWKSKENQKLIQAILLLETPEEIQSFLTDLMTEKEIGECSKRFLVAEMLLEKKSYSDIEKKTGLSSTTIARVSKCVIDGKSGYVSVINKMHHRTPVKLGKGLN